jgi:hypothetical protein
MISVQFPQVHDFIRTKFHGGLLPLKFVADQKIRLIIKAPKEMLLSAKIKKHFRMYAAPIEENGAKGFALISAFYDNDVHPLTITTPLFAEPQTELYQEMLLGNEVDIHFFDENNVEFLAYQAKIECTENVRTAIAGAQFAPFSKDAAKSVINQMEHWYIHSSQKDDANAITLTLERSIFPDNFLIIDARPSSALYTSDSEIHVNKLERLEPGEYQERDIAAVFSRIFPSHQIYLNPLHPEDREEISDLLIVGQDHILFVQAKDSPNTGRVLQNSVERKKATTKKHLDKGLRQMEGAIKYALKSNQMNFHIGERKFSVAIGNAKICGLVVMKELFLDEYHEYTAMTMTAHAEVERPIILLEYNELHSYTMNLRSEQEFFEAFDKVFSIGKENSLFPRIRFGLA